MPGTHAMLSPSSAKRWMTCTPSARLESLLPERDTAASAEGTLAHSCAEMLLRRYLRVNADAVFDDLVDNWRSLDARGGIEDPEVIALMERAKELDVDFWDMMDTVHEHYVRPVYDEFRAYRAKDPDAELLVEARLRLEDYIPGGFGSSDAVIISGHTLHVFDLKYGKGVKVDAERNPQMMCYALGAVRGPGETYLIREVRMTILQPRLAWESTCALSWESLKAWAMDELAPAAKMAWEGKGERVPGDHCRFCKAAPQCRALAALASKESARQPDLMTAEELSEALTKVETLSSYITRLQDHALHLLMDGGQLPGWKVVEGRSVRRFTEPDKVAEVLRSLGWQDEDCWKPRELKTITDVEKMVGRKNFPTLLGRYVSKPQGKPTLAPASDPRQAYSTAESDFAGTI